jgi:hypothetical protein
VKSSYDNDKFLITGAPRSGTLYIAEVFNRLGYRTGHETVVGVGWDGTDGYHPEAWDRFDGEVSHAIAYTPVDETWPLVHVVRDPILVATSILNLRAVARLEKEYSQNSLHQEHPARVIDFLHKHFESVEAKPNPYMRVQLETITPVILNEMVHHLTGDTISDRHLEYALDLRKNYNSAVERLNTSNLEWNPEAVRDWLMTNYQERTMHLEAQYVS